ncbi:MAG: type II toxin-antitoxin system VapC family toxin [Acetobacteraceae bacterium]|nr:type II toxin-antitoxin system VapC family toxin [Acetobacteraceae bacterium]
MEAPAITLVIDASVGVTLVVSERQSAWAQRLLLDHPPPLVPGIFWTECANAFWRMRRAPRSGAKRIDAMAHLALLRLVPVRVAEASSDAAERALHLGIRLDHPVYDCLYLALALDRDAALATADLRFAAAIRRAGLLPLDRLLTPPA